jgi:hypothetical protein
MNESMLSVPFVEGTGIVIGTGDIVGIIIGHGFEWRAQASPNLDASSTASGLFRWRFGRELLIPAVEAGPPYEPNVDESKHVEITIPVGLALDSHGNFAFIWPNDEPQAMSLPRCFIGQTGIMVEVQDSVLRIASDTPIPADYSTPPNNLDLPDSWRGILAKKASVQFPPDLGSFTISIANAAIGSGGFSGTIEAAAINQSVTLFGGFPCILKSVGVSIIRNSITKFELLGSLKIPSFQDLVDIKIGLASNGDFALSLASANPITLDNDFLAVEVTALGIARHRETFALTLSGSIRPKFFSDKIQWPTLELESLVIASDGTIDLGGSWLDLPKRSALNFYGFGLEISRIGFGSGDPDSSSGSANGTRWMGFDGSIRFADGIGVGGTVKGLQISWDPTNPESPQISLSGVAIDLVIPNALELHGHVSLTDRGGVKLFAGGGQLCLSTLNCFLDCQIKIARTGEDTALYVYVDAEFPAGIPIFSTGLALYGIGGLFGQNLKPDRGSGEPWFDGWYKRDPVGLTSAEKWTFAPMHQAFGASASIATAGDDGFAFNSKLVLAILFPGPIALLEGRARLAGKRNSTGDPPFKALAVFDGDASTFEANVEARWKYPPSGPADLINIKGTAEAFFDMNRAERWHVYLGEDNPDSKRIRANILRLFRADAYLMLTQPSIELGASVGIRRKYSFGPLSAKLKAYFESGAVLNYQPLQLEADASLRGRVSLKAFGFGMGVSLRTRADVKTPTPKEFSAVVHAEADFPRFLPDPEATIRFRHRKPGNLTLPVPLEELEVTSRKASESWKTAADNPTIPLDGKPLISFAKPMRDLAGVGGNIQPPSPSHVLGREITYSLVQVTLSKRTAAGAWSIVRARPAEGGVPPICGMWVPVAGTQDNPPCTKLMLFVTNPFDTTPNALTPSAADQFADLFPHYPGVIESVDFEHLKVGIPPHRRELLIGPPAWAVLGVPYGIETRGPSGDVCRCHWIAVVPGYRHGLPTVRDPRIAAPSASAYQWRQRLALYTGTAAAPPHPASITVSLPAPALWVRLRISSMSSFTVTPILNSQASPTLASDGVRQVQQVGGTPGAIQAFDAKGTAADFEVVLTGDGITVVRIDGAVDLFEVSHLGKTSGASGIPGTSAWNEAQTACLAEEEFLFEPNSEYKLQVKTRVEVSPSLPGAALSDGTSVSSSVDVTTERYFKTGGPPGFVGTALDRPIAAGASASESSALRRLGPYIKRTTPINGEMPVYRGYDVSVEFNESYVERMYDSVDTDLAISLVDQDGAGLSLTTGGMEMPVAETGGGVKLGSEWSKAAKAEPRSAEVQWNNLLASSTHAVTTPLHNKPKNDIVVARRSSSPTTPSYPVLRPLRRYIASVTAVNIEGRKPTGLVDADLHSFAFTASRFCSFAHHIYSFDGRLWDSNQGRSTPLAAFTNTEAKAIRYAATHLSATSYDSVAERFKILPLRIPTNLEVTLLRAGTTKWGFLLDSPEPMVAGRVSGTLKRANSQAGAETHRSTVRLANAIYGDHNTTNLNSESIDILVMERRVLNGMLLERVVTSGDGENTLPLHTFTDGSLFEPGAIIRLHAGASATPAITEPRIWHRYRSGDAGAWLFADSVDTVRLMHQGREISRLGVIKPAEFTTLTAQWIWNADRTRVFVFPDGVLDDAELASGTYRFEMQYKLDLTASDPAAAVQSYQGSTEPEAAAIHVVVV